jgi:hypothetical protein
MGCCLSCFEKGGDNEARGGGGSTANGHNKETELASTKSLTVSRAMTSPSIEVRDGTQVSE